MNSWPWAALEAGTPTPAVTLAQAKQSHLAGESSYGSSGWSPEHLQLPAASEMSDAFD